MTLTHDERLLANATAYLIEGQEFYEASILLLCAIQTEEWDHEYDIELTASRSVCIILQNEDHPARKAIWQAFEAILSSDYSLRSLTAHVDYIELEDDWKTKLIEAIQGKVPLNQGIPIQVKPRYPWKYMYFRSTYEIAIAKALDEYKLLFLPNCMARFSSQDPQERMNKEADFLICCEGKWGIIEVDGEPHHSIAAKDHERDRIFRQHGIRVIERYTAEQCMNNPKMVVKEFLELLKRNG